MERVQSIVLAIVVAAVSFFAVRQLFAPAADEHALAYGTPAGVIGADPARERDLPGRRRGGGDAPGGDPRRPPRRGDAPDEQRRARRVPGGGAAGGAADMIAGAARQRGAVLDAARREAGRIGGGLEGDEAGSLLAGRAAALPQARGARDDAEPAAPDGRGPFEFVDEAPPDGAADDVLLSLPLRNGVDPENGTPIESDGLVVHDGEVEFTDDAVLTFPAGGHVDGNAGSISFEIEPRWAGVDETNNSLVQIRDEHVWENNLQLVKNLGALRFIIIDEAGVEHNVNVPITDWPAGEARRVTATWGDALMALYINGEQVGQTTLQNGLHFSDTTPIHIGSDFAGAAYTGAGGQIREFKVYGRALDPDEIR